MEGQEFSDENDQLYDDLQGYPRCVEREMNVRWLLGFFHSECVLNIKELSARLEHVVGLAACTNEYERFVLQCKQKKIEVAINSWGSMRRLIVNRAILLFSTSGNAANLEFAHQIRNSGDLRYAPVIEAFGVARNMAEAAMIALLNRRFLDTIQLPRDVALQLVHIHLWPTRWDLETWYL